MERLSFTYMLTYALPIIPLAMIGIVYFVYLPVFYSELYGISLQFLGFAILATRFYDAIIDPVVGYLSDTGLGAVRRQRRKQYFPIGIALIIFGNFALLNGQALEAYLSSKYVFLVFSFVFFTGWTVFAIPYEAMGAELCFDYQERSKLFAIRDGAIGAGTLFGVFLVEVLQRVFVDTESAYACFAIITNGLLLIAILLSWFNISEKLGGRHSNKSGLKSFLKVWEIREFRIVLLTYLLSGFGSAIPATLLLLYTRYVLAIENGGMLLLAYLIFSLLGFPLWLRICQDLDKRKAWMAGILINSGVFAFSLFLDSDTSQWFWLVVIFSGLGFAGTQIFPSSMQADIIDLEEVKSGERREGIFVGAWSVTRKLSAAMGAGIALPVLGYFGFQAGLDQQTVQSVVVLKYLYAGVPLVCAILALFTLSKYPTSADEHKKYVLITAKKRIGEQGGAWIID